MMEIKRSSQKILRDPKNVIMKPRKEILPLEMMIDLYNDIQYPL